MGCINQKNMGGLLLLSHIMQDDSRLGLGDFVYIFCNYLRRSDGLRKNRGLNFFKPAPDGTELIEWETSPMPMGFTMIYIWHHMVAKFLSWIAMVIISMSYSHIWYVIWY